MTPYLSGILPMRVAPNRLFGSEGGPNESLGSSAIDLLILMLLIEKHETPSRRRGNLANSVIVSPNRRSRCGSSADILRAGHRREKLLCCLNGRFVRSLFCSSRNTKPIETPWQSCKLFYREPKPTEPVRQLGRDSPGTAPA